MSSYRFTILLRQDVYCFTILEEKLLCIESLQWKYYIKIHLLKSTEEYYVFYNLQGCSLIIACYKRHPAPYSGNKGNHQT